jgi:hypothetical protein
MPNRLKPIGNTHETLLSRCEETIARLQKIKTQGTKLFRFGGVSLRNYSVNILVLKMNFAHIPLLGTLLLIFGMPCMEAEPGSTTMLYKV